MEMTPFNNQRYTEHFDELDLNNWGIQKYSFPENGCDMLKEQLIVRNSMLEISVQDKSKMSTKPFRGGEIFLKQHVLYGKFIVRMKNKIAPGTVSSFFIMNEWKKENWEHKEIDIEFLGKDLCKVQFTVHHYKDGGKNHVYKEYTHHLGFDSSKEFHDYGILWTADSISWLVDNKWVHTEKELLINEPMNIRINHWAADPDDTTGIKTWMGPVDRYQLPSTVYYDFVCYEPLTSFL